MPPISEFFILASRFVTFSPETIMDFFSQTREDWENLCLSLNLSRQHAKDLMREAYKGLADEPWKRSGLPKILQDFCQREVNYEGVQAQQTQMSRYDATVKFLVRLSDGSLVESVLMPEKARITLCLSSQVGCAQACTFCHTGRMGLKRQLTPGEIVAQVMLANRWLREHPEWGHRWQYPSGFRVTNVVFMGMGEPLDNVDAVMKALCILTDPYGFHLALRRISISTAGHLPGLVRLLKYYPAVSLALSLHNPHSRERSQLMPINRRWPINEVLSFLRQHFAKIQQKKHLLVQYTVIEGVNDSDQHASSLIDLLEGLPVKLNLIPLNDIDQVRFQSPEPEHLQKFRNILHQHGLRVMVRYSKGQDIAAACGQLVVKA